jgi:hypothetical protein
LPPVAVDAAEAPPADVVCVMPVVVADSLPMVVLPPVDASAVPLPAVVLV